LTVWAGGPTRSCSDHIAEAPDHAATASARLVNVLRLRGSTAAAVPCIRTMIARYGGAIRKRVSAE
jgi:hypothetical protein